jgi:hypothetical protein
VINRDEWLAALKAAECVHDESALTAHEIGTLLGLKESATKERIRKLVTDGKAVAVRKHIVDTSGRQQSVSAYRLVK